MSLHLPQAGVVAKAIPAVFLLASLVSANAQASFRAPAQSAAFSAALQQSAALDHDLALPEAPLPVSSSDPAWPVSRSDAASDAPQTPQTAVHTVTPAPSHPLGMAGPYDRYIQPGQAAPRLTALDKVCMGVRESVTPFAAAGWVVSATYEQIFNGPPNYGETAKGYSQRLGAAAARGASDNIFAASLFAPILHQDPRYYKLGEARSTFTRIVYAGSRTLITRSDGGKATVNFSQLLGHLGATSLTQAYYPPGNRGFAALGRTYGESLLGQSLSFVVSEFFSQALDALHLQAIHIAP